MTDTTEVKAAYGALKAGEGYFIGQSLLSLEAATEAVDVADELVDELFADWDRTGWTSGNPKAVSRGWLKIASGEYMDRIQGVNTSDDSKGRGRRLRDEGKNDLLNLLDAGGPIVDGERQRRTGDDGEGSDRAIRLRVT